MSHVIAFLEDAGWVANLMALLGVPGVGWLAIRLVRSLLAVARIDKAIPADFEHKWTDAFAKEIARIAIVDDQQADFPVAELRADGYQIQTYKQVTLSITAQLSLYDIVFLDMKGVVKDDPENGGMKLIAELRRLNPVQKICAVSSKTFDINATEFFRQADDAKKKPLTAQECRSVISAFLTDLFSAKALRDGAALAMERLPKNRRAEVVTQIRRYCAEQVSLEKLREGIAQSADDPTLGYLLTNIARAVAHAG